VYLIRLTVQEEGAGLELAVVSAADTLLSRYWELFSCFLMGLTTPTLQPTKPIPQECISLGERKVTCSSSVNLLFFRGKTGIMSVICEIPIE
jgi:hypothetical protein